MNVIVMDKPGSYKPVELLFFADNIRIEYPVPHHAFIIPGIQTGQNRDNDQDEVKR